MIDSSTPKCIGLGISELSNAIDYTTAIDALTLSRNPGEFYPLIGPNGAGKIKTLRMIAGLLKPAPGSVSIFGIVARVNELSPNLGDGVDR